MKVLISGLGVAGATLAWWLVRCGFQVTIVERSPAPRSGGYMIDFWGFGYEVAERMGLIGELREAGYLIDQLQLVREDGRRFATIDARGLGRALRDRFFSILRADLAAGLYGRIQGDVEVRFGDQIRLMTPTDHGVDVSFEHAQEESFEVVIGADGMHSGVRRGIFPDQREYPIGFWVASFSAQAYPHRDPAAYVSFTEVGRQVARYALRDDRTAFLFVFRAPADGIPGPRSLGDQKDWLRRLYQGGWECPEILARLDTCEELYFDEVGQVRAPRWSSGRIALVGDAAYCPSLLAGEGASLAMAGAYVLAGELALCRGDYPGAFSRYEHHLRRVVERKQRAALGIGGWFVPKTRVGLFARNGLSRIAAVPGLTNLMIGGMVSESFQLPSYRMS